MLGDRRFDPGLECLDLETVLACGKTGINGCPFAPGLLPFTIKAIEAVAKPNSFLWAEQGRRKGNLGARGGCTQRDLSSDWNRAAVYRDALDNDREVGD